MVVRGFSFESFTLVDTNNRARSKRGRTRRPVKIRAQVEANLEPPTNLADHHTFNVGFLVVYRDLHETWAVFAAIASGTGRR